MERAVAQLMNMLGGRQDIELLMDEPMCRHTTFKIGGPARLFVKACGADAALLAIRSAQSVGITPLVVGNGSNLLVSDDGIRGVVVKLSGGKCRLSADGLVQTDGGVTMYSAAKFAQQNSLGGFEFLHGIPGSMGGAVVMNAGAYEGEISQCLVSSLYLSESGKVETLDLIGHEFSYRTSFFKKHPHATVLSSTFRLEHKDGAAVSAKMDELMGRRRDKQPLEFPSAGSVFKRPPGHFAGALIEQCGLKGFSVGGAQVSPKHAGFIVNTGGATCADVLGLIEHIRTTVLREMGVELECEICRV